MLCTVFAYVSRLYHCLADIFHISGFTNTFERGLFGHSYSSSHKFWNQFHNLLILEHRGKHNLLFQITKSMCLSFSMSGIVLIIQKRRHNSLPVFHLRSHLIYNACVDAKCARETAAVRNGITNAAQVASRPTFFGYVG